MPVSPAPIAKGPVRTASSSLADGESEQVHRLTVLCACPVPCQPGEWPALVHRRRISACPWAQ